LKSLDEAWGEGARERCAPREMLDAFAEVVEAADVLKAQEVDADRLIFLAK
jgi:hypothetical protein